MNRIELPEKHKELLLKTPEAGMGYHIVDVTLSDGTTLQDVTVVNSTHVLLDNNITKEEIINLKIKK